MVSCPAVGIILKDLQSLLLTSNCFDDEQKRRDVFDHKAPTNDDYRFNRREFHADLMNEALFGDSVSFLSVISYRLNQYRFENFNGFRRLTIWTSATLRRRGVLPFWVNGRTG